MYKTHEHRREFSGMFLLPYTYVTLNYYSSKFSFDFKLIIKMRLIYTELGQKFRKEIFHDQFKELEHSPSIESQHEQPKSSLSRVVPSQFTASLNNCMPLIEERSTENS